MTLPSVFIIITNMKKGVSLSMLLSVVAIFVFVFFLVDNINAATDELNLNQVNWLHRDVSSWPATSTVTGTRISPNEICIFHNEAGQWPTSLFGDPGQEIQVEGNPWIFAQIGGQWYGATWDWLRVGQECKGESLKSLGSEQIRIPPLDASWVPKVGDTIGLMMSTRARDSVQAGKFRSNVVLVTVDKSIVDPNDNSNGTGGVPSNTIAIDPSKAVPGETVTIYGSGLSGTVDLISSQGLTYSTSGAFNSSGTEYQFEVRDNWLADSYTIRVTSTNGIIESSKKLIINNGGKPFGLVIKPNLPTEGLPNFGELVALIFTWSLNILDIVVFVMIFFAGFKWFTAAGNTAQVNEARNQITNAITGAIILFAAWVILYTINPDLVGGKFTLPGVGGSSTQQSP